MVRSVKPKSEIGPLPEIIVTALEKSKERRFLLDLEEKILSLIEEIISGSSRSNGGELQRQNVTVPHKDLKNKYYRALLHKTCDYYKLARSEGLSYFSIHAREDINYNKIQSQIVQGGVTLSEIFDNCLKTSIEEFSFEQPPGKFRGFESTSFEDGSRKFTRGHGKHLQSSSQHIQHQYFESSQNSMNGTFFPNPSHFDPPSMYMGYYPPMYYNGSNHPLNFQPVFINPYSSPYINPYVSTKTSERKHQSNSETNEAYDGIPLQESGTPSQEPQIPKTTEPELDPIHIEPDQTSQDPHQISQEPDKGSS
ncbi:hypothetical protein CLIB1444_02S03488 [[Candida] jaroonii]|uniref:Uncharacterized protein n=1 Tax=[Candida] jaroonii TaxID=467808 RepID=A0ACA9Y316_9ASCO|nr:hypothetical protein CLIB1444_02S03488 [[Candida] jaroonii]